MIEPAKLSPEIIDYVRLLAGANHTDRQIASLLNRSVGWVRKVRRLGGIEAGGVYTRTARAQYRFDLIDTEEL